MTALSTHDAPEDNTLPTVVYALYLIGLINGVTVLIGVPMIVLGAAILGLTHVWFALRSIMGLVYLSRGEAYPRPRTWLI